MRNKIEVTEGQKYGKLTIIKEVSPISSKRRILCKCDCGNTKVVSLYNLVRGKTLSCGCYRKKLAVEYGKRFLKYEKEATSSLLYSIWHGMKCRCKTATSGSYERYGKKGIKVCDEWNNDYMAFYNWAITNGYSEGLTIDRIDSNGNYEPSNCRWANYVEQANNRSTNIYLSYDGKRHTITEWSKILNIPKHIFFNRRYKGWSDEKILSTPVRNIKRRKKLK